MPPETSELSARQEQEARLIEQVCQEAFVPDPEPLAAPVLLVGLGGTGAEVLRRVKTRIAQLPTIHACRFLIVDLDADTQKPQGPLLGFERHEFCFVERGLGRVVFRQPRNHPGLVERFDLKDPNVKQRLENIFAGEGAGAGQVRPLGLMSFYANASKFETLLANAMRDLTHKWSELEQRLRTDRPTGTSERAAFYVILVASLCGGTGSSALIDVAVMLRNKLADRPSQFSAILTLPDVYHEIVRGKIDEERLIKANTYATVHELHYFQTGAARRDGVRLSGVTDGGMEAPAKLFDRTYFAARTDAQGRDLGSMKAVFETIALQITAEVALTIGGKLQTGLANDAAIKGLADCPRSGQPRFYGTLGASALSVSAQRLLRFCVYRQMRDYLGENMLGGPVSEQAIDQDVDAWLAAACLEERAAMRGDMVLDRVKRAAYTGPDGFVNKLYERRHGNEAVHYKDKVFVQKFDEVRKKWGDTELPAIKQALREQRQPLVDEYRKSIITRISELLRTRGIRYAQSFALRLHAALDSAFRELKGEAADFNTDAIKWDGEAKQKLGPLKSFFGQFGTDERQQVEVITRLRSALDAAVDGEARDATAAIIAGLLKVVESQMDALRKLIDGAEKIHSRYETEAAVQLPPVRTAPRRDEAEVDVTTREFLEAFYLRNRMPAEEVAKEFAAADSKDALEHFRGICTTDRDNPARRQLLRRIAGHFAVAARSLTINDVLQWEAEAGGQRGHHASLRLEEAVKACRPLWRADPGVMGVKFSDVVVIGLPKSSTQDVRNLVGARLHELQPVLNADERYQGQSHQFDTDDALRIYAIRLSHGGLPYYLSAWEELRREYQGWMRKGAHPVHVLPRSVVDQMPALEPAEDFTDAERAFAIALAYGWIAVRGNFYYFNLQKPEGSDGYEAVVHSHWDCIAFENKQPRPAAGALQKMVDNRSFRFAGRTKPERSLKLGGGGRAAALKEFAESGGAVRQILDLYGELGECAGNDEVARDLKTYVEDLLRRYKPDDDLYETVRRECELLRREYSRIRPRIAAS